MNTRFRFFRRALVAASIAGLALSGLAAAAPLPGDNFEADDGNLIVNGATTTDWNAASPSVFNDLPTNADNTLTGGTQEVDHPSDWDVTISNNTNKKADILRSYVKTTSPFFRVGVVRNQNPSGTTAYSVEFNQSTATYPNGLPVRTLGDALIVFDFQGNNVTAPVTRHRWIDPGACAGPGSVSAPCWSVGASLNTSQAIGANNASGVLDTVANPDQTLVATTFDELAINFQSAFGVPPNTCLSFGQATIRSREGAAFGSALQDLMGPMPISVGNCDVAIEKDVVAVNGSALLNPSSVPFDATLAYRVRVFLAPGSSPIAADQLTVKDTTVSDDSLTNAPLVPVRYLGVISGDDGDNVLEQHERWVYTLDTYGRQVTQTANRCADVVNSAKVTVTGGDTNPANNEATRTTPVACVPDIAIDKSGPAQVDENDTITYTVDVTNVGHPVGIARADIRVTDPAVTAANLEFFSVISGDADTVLEKDEVWRYRLVGGAPITRQGAMCGNLDNTAIVDALSGETNTQNNSSTVTTFVRCPDYAVDKTAGAASYPYSAGSVSWSVVVTNTGNVDLSLPSLADTTVTLSGPSSSLGAGDDAAIFEVDEVLTYTGSEPIAGRCGEISNTVSATVQDGVVQIARRDTATTTVTCVPDIAIVKSGPESVGFGETITYTVDVSNVGDPLSIPRADIHVTDPKVAGTTELVFASVVTGDTDAYLEKNDVWRYALVGGAVTLPADVCAPIDNTAVVKALAYETNTSNNTSTATTDVACVPDIAIVKSGPESVGFGETITYTVDVSNVGDPLSIPRADIHVTDPKVAGTTELVFASVVTGDTDAYLEKNDVWRYALVGGAVTLPADVCAPIDNTAVVKALVNETNTSNNTSTVTTAVTCVPDIAIVKSGPSQVEKGDTITYTVNVTSVGHPLPIARADIHVTDPMVTDTELAFGSVVTGDPDDYLEKDEVWQYGLTGGAPVTLPAATCGDITNTARVAALTGEQSLDNNHSAVTTFVRCPDYTVVKTPGADRVPFGAGSVSWSVAVTNTGNVDLAIPALTDVTVALNGPSSSLGEGDDPAVFQKNEVLTYTGTEQIAGRCGEIANTVSAKLLYGEVQIERANTATTTVACIPDLAIQKAGPQSVNFGDTISYLVNVTSVGDPLPVARADIHVTDPAVSGEELIFFEEVVGTGDGDDMLETNEVWTYRLAGGGAVTLPANRCAPIDNTAIVALAADVNAANDQSSVSTSVLCTLNLSIAKTSDKTTYAAGQTITYTVTVTNTGQAAVLFSAIQVSDPSLPSLALVGQAPAELAPGASLTYTGTRTTSIADCGTVPNTVTVALGLDAQETTVADNTATHNVTVTCTLNLAIAKSADKASYAPGEVISYTVTVHNTGQLPVPFGQIAVSDPTLPNLTLVGTAPATLAVGASVSYTGTRQASAADCGNVVNTATVGLVGGAQAESTTVDNTASVTVGVAGGACNPVVIAGEQATTLSITKLGPKSSQVRRAVRYTLRITNTGASVARNVIVRDPVPSGMTVAKLPANATLSNRQVRWSIGDLQPGQSVTFSVLLRAERNVTRRICNVGFSSAGNAPEVSSRACTRFVKVVRRVLLPKVTG